ncbi:lactoylglutathione lyase [Metabacillus crassostreae]|uniref:VOC family protein n=1 Tax=Metabacillus crassostreae TaxID=929098 RepID=UPI0019562A37|nr:VOC family protein [Metabacillus crassostreae]MBM7602117.1 lactoylglutathione lyase [Metabacillus crassostreae]
MAVLGFEHVGVQITEIEKSIKFYQDVVNLELIDQFIHTDGKLKLAFLGLNGEIIVELIEGYNPDLPEEGKVHHIAFKVNEIEKEKQRLEGLGVELIFDDITTLPNGAKYLFFKGPDREWIEFYEASN